MWRCAGWPFFNYPTSITSAPRISLCSFLELSLSYSHSKDSSVDDTPQVSGGYTQDLDLDNPSYSNWSRDVT